MGRKAEYLRISLALRDLENANRVILALKHIAPETKDLLRDCLVPAREYLNERKIIVEPMKV